MTERIVVDASVAAKWFLDDEFEANADLAKLLLVRMLQGSLEVHAPAIIQQEFGNLLAKACLTRLRDRSPRLTKEAAIGHLEDFLELPIQYQEFELASASDALGLAVHYHKGFYDASYLQLARRLNCQWCMADAKFLRAVPADFPLGLVLQLSELRQTPDVR